MYMYLHAGMQGACLCDALLWFSSEHFKSFYSCPLEASDNKICIGRLNFILYLCECICTCTHVCMLEL